MGCEGQLGHFTIDHNRNICKHIHVVIVCNTVFFHFLGIAEIRPLNNSVGKLTLNLFSKYSLLANLPLLYTSYFLAFPYLVSDYSTIYFMKLLLHKVCMHACSLVTNWSVVVEIDPQVEAR